MQQTRRTFVKGAAVGAAGLAAPGLASADDLDDFDLSADSHEAVVVFEDNDDVDRLGELDLAEGYRKLRVLPMGYAEFTTDQLRTVADWEETVALTPNHELDYHNDDARELTRSNEVHDDLGYTGENAEVAVIDTGVNGSHPDLEDNLAANYQVAENPLSSDGGIVVDAGDADTDDVGHGTHCVGSVAGDGSQSDGEYQGMAPDATVYSYAVNATLYVVYAVEAYDHLIAGKRDGDNDVNVVSNSWGSSSGDDFDPYHAINVATWFAHQAGILPVFSAGNSGPDTDTLNDYAKAPQVLGVAATDDERNVVDFSSRGRAPDHELSNYDRREAYQNASELYGGAQEDEIDGPLGVYRIGVGAKGDMVMSTLSPYDPLQGYAPDEEEWYGLLSGTSMSCPVTSGVAALVADAYVENEGENPDPIGLLNTVEAEAVEVEDAEPEYTPYNMGAGFPDAYESVERAEKGNLANFQQVQLTGD